MRLFKKNFILLLIFAFILASCVPAGVEEIVKFEKPDIRDAFCGVHINYQFCKCAFHNDFCDAIGMSKSQANSHVQGEYQKWLDGLREDFIISCELAGGIADGEECRYCEEGYIASGRDCVEESSQEEAVKQEFQADGPLTNNCEIKQDEFDRDWKKYSDIDEAIPFAERSYEAKQALTAYDQMIDLMVEGFALERDWEIEAQMQDELEEYRSALVQDLKTNLLKAFWRLSWVTYTTVKSGQGLGGSYSNLLTTGAGVEAIGSGLKVVQGIIPADSQLAIDTSTVSGKAKSVGANAALEAIDSLGDPTKIATELFKSAANASLPSADLTPEEIGILKEQHLTKGVVDEILQKSRKLNDDRQSRMAEIEEEIAQLQQSIADWENQEKQRVKVLLEESCKDLKKQFEENN